MQVRPFLIIPPLAELLPDPRSLSKPSQCLSLAQISKASQWVHGCTSKNECLLFYATEFGREGEFLNE